MLECLIGIVLIVCDELYGNVEKCEAREDVVGDMQFGWLLHGCDLNRDGEKEEDDVLHERDEDEVEHLEEPRGHLLAENSPAVIFVVPVDYRSEHAIRFSFRVLFRHRYTAMELASRSKAILLMP